MEVLDTSAYTSPAEWISLPDLMKHVAGTLKKNKDCEIKLVRNDKQFHISVSIEGNVTQGDVIISDWRKKRIVR